MTVGLKYVERYLRDARGHNWSHLVAKHGLKPNRRMALTRDRREEVARARATRQWRLAPPEGGRAKTRRSRIIPRSPNHARIRAFSRLTLRRSSPAARLHKSAFLNI